VQVDRPLLTAVAYVGVSLRMRVLAGAGKRGVSRLGRAHVRADV